MGRAAASGDGINWLTLGVIIAFHLGAVAALFFFTWQRLAVTAALYVLAINVGIGMCYHRLLTHRGYQTPKWIEYIMSICATLSLEAGPSSGYRFIACITSSATTKATRTRRARAAGGHIPAG